MYYIDLIIIKSEPLDETLFVKYQIEFRQYIINKGSATILIFNCERETFNFQKQHIF